MPFIETYASSSLAGFFSVCSGVIGLILLFLSYKILNLGYSRLSQALDWIRLISDLPNNIAHARTGDILCVEGRCGQSFSEPMLVSPLSRATCLAYWVIVRTGINGKIRYLRRKAVRFWLNLSQGHRILVIPQNSGVRELPYNDEEVDSPFDPELEQHLETLIVKSKKANLKGVDHNRLEPGNVCTVIGQVTGYDIVGSPYRGWNFPVIGHDESFLLVMPGSKRDIRGRLVRKALTSIAVIILGYAAMIEFVFLVGLALMLQPLFGLLIWLVMIYVSFAFVEKTASVTQD